jgi:hypothetical protein
MSMPVPESTDVEATPATPAEPVTPAPLPETPDPPTESEVRSRMMRDVNGVDEEGNLRWYPREHVAELRGESQRRRQQLREREEEVARLQAAVNERDAADEATRLALLQEQEQYQELASEWQQKFESLQAESAQQQVTMLRMRVAGEVGLPSELADRLRGDDEETIRADAERLATLVVREEDTQPQPQVLRTTQAVPGGGPPARDDAMRRAEYFGREQKSSVFDVKEDSLRHGT